MSSAGHVMDMIQRSRYNDSIRKKRIERISKIRDAYQEEVRKKHPIGTHEVKLSSEKLIAIKQRIRLQLIREKRIKRIISSLFNGNNRRLYLLFCD
ncbi:hypothetical protein [Saccharicrinis aurantiacus]|uniref:hypothetical protein n=1 Tax=Saccharicrinis aurantiacus TaxID=1849719 RepID=UPI002491C83C|nr:hypothetical protein [Saccharicrinis aurantiacus]